jgi:hypothetical protein
MAFKMAARAEDAVAQKPTFQFLDGAPEAKSVPLFGTFELRLNLEATFDNPFDPNDIDVHAVFIPAKGDSVKVNGFLDRPFTRRLENDVEKIEPSGKPFWKIRFTPAIEGEWKYRVFAKDRNGSAQLPEAGFQAVKSTSPGFIRRCKSNPMVFAFDNGEPFFAVGENVCWGGKRGSFDYDDWLPALGKAGGNFIRIWMCSWNCALEWSKTNRNEWRSGEYHDAGVYSLDNAWKLDTILDAAEKNGIKVMLCFGTYGEFNDGGYFGEGQWKCNPYNVANGGPCAKPEDFWTNAAARKLYRQRLRYLAARLGHRTNIQSWEFWNEAKAPAAWVGEMARCLKGTGEFQGNAADPYGHLVTTTYGTPEIWNIPEIDFTQTHSYGIGDIADQGPVARNEARNHAAFGKPHLMGEFGIDWRSPDIKYDAEGRGVNLHNTMWASVFSGDAGGAMIWWWDSYIHPKNLYSHFSPLRKFTDSVPWAQGEWKPLKVVPADSQANAGGPALQVYGLSNGEAAIIWVHNAAHQWKNVFEKKSIPAIRERDIIIHELPADKYRLEWWDTWKGEVSRREEVRSANGELRLRLSYVDTDLAIRLDSVK